MRDRVSMATYVFSILTTYKQKSNLRIVVTKLSEIMINCLMLYNISHPNVFSIFICIPSACMF